MADTNTAILTGTLCLAAGAIAENITSTPLSSSVPTGKHPASIAISPSGKYAYVANEGSHTISVFSIDSKSGILSTQSTKSLDGAGNPEFITISPSGKFMYVATSGDSPVIVVYRINPDNGNLAASQEVELQIDTPSIALDSSGKFAYAVDYFGVDVFGIDQHTGKLSLLEKRKITGAQRPRFIGIDPHDKFVYITTPDGATPTNGPGHVLTYAVNPETGLLTDRRSAKTEINPDQLVVHPSGKFVYVTNEYSGSLSMYAVNPSNGSLRPIGTATAKGILGAIAIHPTGKFVYLPEGSNAFQVGSRLDVSGPNAVSIYSVNHESGELDFKKRVIVGVDVRPGERPTSAAVHPNGKFLYIANSKSNNISIYTINQETGELTAPRM